LPTLGDNLGHVIAESISAGTRVLISTNPPWRNLNRQGQGWDIDVSSGVDQFRRAIAELAEKTSEERRQLRDKIKVSKPVNFIEQVDKNRALFNGIEN